eukprot:5257725-Alexandrium_andersonii.AAC.1
MCIRDSLLSNGLPYEVHLPVTWARGTYWDPVASVWMARTTGPPRRRTIDGVPIGPFRVCAGRLPRG